MQDGEIDEITRAALKNEEARLAGVKKAVNGSVATIPLDQSRPLDLAGKFFVVGPSSVEPKNMEPGFVNTDTGHLGDAALKAMLAALAEAAKHPVGSLGQRSAANRAADVVDTRLTEIRTAGDAKTLFKSEANSSIVSLIGETKRQVSVDAVALAKSLVGMNGVQEQGALAAVYAMTSALAAKGISVLAQKSVDVIGQGFDKAEAVAGKLVSSLSSKTTNIATQSKLGEIFEDACGKLKGSGLSREAIKDFIGKNTGKLNVLLEMAHHSDNLARVAMASPATISGLLKLADNDEFRTAAGTLVKDAGDAATFVPGMRGAGSAAIVLGGVMSGESSKDTGAHLFIASFAVAGGVLAGAAAGAGMGLMTGGAGALPAGYAGAIVGQELGSSIAEAILDKIGHTRSGPQVSEAERMGAVRSLGEQGGEAVRNLIPGGNKANDLAGAAPPPSRGMPEMERIRELRSGS